MREGHADSLVEAGIRFALTHEGMTTVLVGYSTFEHLEYAAAAAEKGPLPRAALDRLAALWREKSSDPRRPPGERGLGMTV